MSYSSSYLYGSRYTDSSYSGRSALSSSRYAPRVGYSSGNTLLDKYNAKNGLSSALPSKPTLNDSSKYNSSSSFKTGRTALETDADLVRPSIRSRATSVTRDVGSSRKDRGRDSSISRRGTTRDYSQPLEPRSRVRESSLSRRTSTRDYPPFSSNAREPSYRQPSPVRTSRAPVPEFETITSNYDKSRRGGNKASRSPTSNYGTNGYMNGHASPKTEAEQRSRPTMISVERQIADTTTAYSPSFARNRSTNNNKDRENGTESPAKSSAGSSRRDEVLENGDRVSPYYSDSTKKYLDPHAGLVGLKNIGNTCFMNSILQCLSNTRPLKDYCIDRRYEKDINKSLSPMKGRLVEAFSEIIRQLWYPSPSRSAVSTSSFKRQIETFSKRFSGYDQQDCQEFLRFLIEGLHEDVNKVTKRHREAIPNFDSFGDESKAKKTWDFYLRKDRSYIVDLFMGQLKSSLTCAECEHVSTTFDPFWDLSLPIPKNAYMHDRLDLQLCLDKFTREEVLEGDERPTCDKCKARRRMTKKFTIYKFPKILVIHLKRFSEGRYRQKIQSKVEFPHRLEIASPVSMNRETFSLYAVSNHSGSCYGGHYTAYCKNPETAIWYSFNDSLVSVMNESSVQSKEAYVLFYESTPSTRSKSHL